MRAIKNFNDYNYTRIYEAEGSENNNSVKSIEALMGLFFKCYTFAATKIPNYANVAADLEKISKEPELKAKGDLIFNIVSGIAPKMGKEYNPLVGKLVPIASIIKRAYNHIIESEEGKKSAKEINSAISKIMTDSLEGLKNVVTSIKESSIVDYRSFRYKMILEAEENELEGKNRGDREDILNSIKSVQSLLAQQANTGLTDSVKQFAEKGISDLESITAKLKDSKSWGELKRSARKEKMKEYVEKIANLNKGMTDLIYSEANKVGVDKKTAEFIKQISDELTELTEEETKIKIKQQELASKEKSANVEEYKVGDSVKYKRDNGEEATSKIEKIEGDKYFFKTEDGKEFSKDKKDIIGKGEEPKKEEAKKEEGEVIESGNVDKENLKKDGKNAEKIKEFQVNYNKSGYFSKISEDGRYGKNTEAAIRKIAGLSKQMANKEINTDEGKKMTQDIMDLAKKLSEGK